MISRSRLKVFLRPWPWLVLGLLGPAGCEPATLSSEAADPELQAAERTAQSARPPSVTKVDPVSFIAGADGVLTITGKGFVPGLSVSVGGLLTPPPTVVSSTKIQVALPSGALPAGATSVKVTLADGRSSERTDLFSIVADPIALQLQQPLQRFAVTNPRSPVVADFNLDGRPDVAMIAQPSLALTVQLSTLTGSSVTTTLSPIADAFDLFGGDLNADGKPDLVVTTQGFANMVGVLLGKGDGTFQPVAWLTNVGSGFSPYQHNQVDIGDYNADGRADLIIGDASGSVIFAAGNGDGTFAAGVTLFSLSYVIRAIRLGDIDGKPGPEIVAVGGNLGASGGGLVTIARQPDGSSKVITNSTFSDNLYGLAVADYDGDGKKDLATISGTGKLQLYQGNGDGTFAAPVSNPIGGNGSFLLAADVNGDGKMDFISGGYTADVTTDFATTTVSLSNGDGTVRSAAVVLDVAAQHSGAALADMNKDGRLDLILTHGKANELEILSGRLDGSFPGMNSVYQATASTLVDLNADGKGDLVYVNSGQNKLTVALGDGTGTFAAARSFDTDKGPSAVVTGDFNADGKLDVAVSCYDTNLVSLLLGNGDGTFAPQRTFSVGKGPNSLVAVDLDGDGKLDIVTANTDSDNVSVLLGNGTGNFAASHEYAAGKAPVAVAAGDLNVDGKPDIVTSNADSGNIAYLQGGTLTPGTLLTAKFFTAGTTPSAVAIADVNNDGKLDVVTVNSDTNNLALLAGHGDGTFTAAKSSPTCEFPVSLAVAELTGDGKLDAVVQCAGGKRSQALIGVGDGSFIPSPRLLPLGSSLAVGDINADMKPDLVIPDGTNPSQVYLNTHR